MQIPLSAEPVPGTAPPVPVHGQTGGGKAPGGGFADVFAPPLPEARTPDAPGSSPLHMATPIPQGPSFMPVAGTMPQPDQLPIPAPLHPGPPVLKVSPTAAPHDMTPPEVPRVQQTGARTGVTDPVLPRAGAPDGSHGLTGQASLLRPGADALKTPPAHEADMANTATPDGKPQAARAEPHMPVTHEPPPEGPSPADGGGPDGGSPVANALSAPRIAGENPPRPAQVAQVAQVARVADGSDAQGGAGGKAVPPQAGDRVHHPDVQTTDVHPAADPAGLGDMSKTQNGPPQPDAPTADDAGSEPPSAPDTTNAQPVLPVQPPNPGPASPTLSVAILVSPEIRPEGRNPVGPAAGPLQGHPSPSPSPITGNGPAPPQLPLSGAVPVPLPLPVADRTMPYRPADPSMPPERQPAASQGLRPIPQDPALPNGDAVAPGGTSAPQAAPPIARGQQTIPPSPAMPARTVAVATPPPVIPARPVPDPVPVLPMAAKDAPPPLLSSAPSVALPRPAPTPRHPAPGPSEPAPPPDRSRWWATVSPPVSDASRPAAHSGSATPPIGHPGGALSPVAVSLPGGPPAALPGARQGPQPGRVEAAGITPPPTIPPAPAVEPAEPDTTSPGPASTATPATPATGPALPPATPATVPLSLHPESAPPAADPGTQEAPLAPTLGPEQARTVSTPAAPQASEMPRHVARQLAEALQPRPDGPVELRLSPEELGSVRITLSGDDGAMMVLVHADREDTAALMRRHADLLDQELRAAGYQDVNLTFSGGDTPGTGAGSQDDGRPAETTVGASVPAPDGPATTGPALPPQDRLDLRL